MSDWAPDVPQAVRSELPPFGIKPHWVTFSFSAQANRLYDLYNAHVNRNRGDLVVWPTLDDLAAMMGLSRGAKVTPYMRELEAGGAVAVETVTKTGGKGRRYIVTLKVHPPAGYAGPLQSSDWHHEVKVAKPAQMTMQERAMAVNSRESAGQKASVEKGDVHPAEGTDHPGGVNSAKTAGQEVHPLDGMYVGPLEGRDVGPLEGSVTSNKVNQNKIEGAAPSARSAGDARRASAGSSARATRGGSAASKKASTSKGQGGTGARMTREQAAAVRTVEAGLPAELVALLPKHRPPVVRHALLEAVSGRTAQQIVERVSRRWIAWGYALQAHDGEIERPVGVLVRLLEHGKCSDPLCEDGTVLDTGAGCRACQERRTTRRTASKRSSGTSVPGQRPATESTAPAAWACVDCERTGKGPAPEDGVCRDCRAAAEAAAQQLASRLEQEAPAAGLDRQTREREEVEDVGAQQVPVVENVPSVPVQLSPKEPTSDHETARLRAQLLAENPWMAEYATKPEPMPTAPF
ncbi:hypothetical protein [Streptomyces lavendulocolor]|uniref:hypothetical protein n=1 Tax=Streptomyces lavendulocolor TaxID=67316 RepID=UPI003C2DA813